MSIKYLYIVFEKYKQENGLKLSSVFFFSLKVSYYVEYSTQAIKNATNIR